MPDTHRITDAQQVLDFDFSGATRPYVLKSIAYDPVHRLDLTRLPFGPPAAMAAFVRSLPISEDNPWILQEFVEGTEYCTHSTVRDGRLTVYCCCESSAFQVNYAMRRQARRSARGSSGSSASQRLTGQVSLRLHRGRATARSSRSSATRARTRRSRCSTTTRRRRRRLPRATGLGAGVVVPDGGQPSDVLDLPRALAAAHRPGPRARGCARSARGTDAIFDRADPLPFFVEHHVQIPWLLLQNLRRGGSWIRVDFNIGKLVEAGGD